MGRELRLCEIFEENIENRFGISAIYSENAGV